MRTLLQESGGLRRTAAAQSPMPMSGARLGPFMRTMIAAFLVLSILSYVAYLLPGPPAHATPVPSEAGDGR